MRQIAGPTSAVVLMALIALAAGVSYRVVSSKKADPPTLDFGQPLQWTTNSRSVGCGNIRFETHSLDKTTRVTIHCDGQVTVEGPRDRAAQAFWDEVIRQTPRNYAEPKRVLAELQP